MATAQAISGHSGRLQLIDGLGTTYNLQAHRWQASLQSQEDDITFADTASSSKLAARLFVVSARPRFEFTFEAFWTTKDNPFNVPDKIHQGEWLQVSLWIGDPGLVLPPSWSFYLLVKSFDMEASVRDVYRYTGSGMGMFNPDSSVTDTLFPATYF